MKANPHIRMSDDLKKRIDEYCYANNISKSEGMRRLIELGLFNNELNEQVNMTNKLMNKIYSRQSYIKDFLEQFYCDMEIEELRKISNNKALKEFKSRYSRDLFND